MVLLYATDKRVLGLCSRRSPWQVLTRADLEALGYPRPRGDFYFCSELEPMEVPEWLSTLPDHLLAAAPPRPYGAPAVITWQDIIESAT
jgi:hypothetical protein